MTFCSEAACSARLRHALAGLLRAAVLLAALWLGLGLPAARAAVDVGTDAGVVRLSAETDAVALGSAQRFLVDRERSLDLAAVRALDADPRWRRSDRATPSWGLTTAAVWSRLTVVNDSPRTKWMLGHTDVLAMELDFWIVYRDGRVVHLQAGAFRPRGPDQADVLGHAFAVELPRGEPVQIYGRIRNDDAVIVAQYLRTPENLTRSDLEACVMHMLYVGVALAMILYNLFVYVALRERAHLLYVLATTALLVGNNAINGMTSRFLLPDSPLAAYLSLLLSLSVAVPLLSLFSASFLRENGRLARFTTRASIALGVASLTVGMAFDLGWSILLMANGIMTCCVLLWIGVRNAWRGDRPAQLYLLGYVWFLVGALILQLGLLGVLPHWRGVMEVGSCIEAVLFSMALAERMRQIRDEKNAALSAADAHRRVAMEQQQLALETVERYNRKLEAEVRARTEELASAQHKLVASEKMAALGVFTAGVAHEINNPANFAALGAQNAQAQIGRFRAFVDELLDADADAGIRAGFDGHFGKLASSVELVRTGLKRIEHVVRQLRASEPGADAGMRPADVVESLASTWRLFASSLQSAPEMVQAFADRPSVECVPAELEQLFLALFSNAVHAIEDAGSQRPGHAGRVTLGAEVRAGQLVVTVADNGIGIAADTLDKVFDPFFTTKAVGRGAGLGLSMAREVARRHHGSLEVDSTAGVGSTFVLTLPLVQPR